MADSTDVAVVGLGESLVRLVTPGHERLEQANRLDMDVGGAELNALIGLAALGLDATWITRLADNPLARRITAHAAQLGVRTVTDWDPDARTPLYFVEHGSRPRPTEVLYDRGHTAMAGLTADSFDWPAVVAGATAVLTTGITCALGEGNPAAVRAFLSHGHEAGALTVFDVNHRSRLWAWEQAAPVLRGVIQHADVLLASGHDLTEILETGAEAATDIELAREAIETFGHEIVLLRDSVRGGDGRVTVTATAVTPTSAHVSHIHEAHVVDPFGAGDAALAAFLDGVLRGEDLDTATDRAAWACAFQHTICGDAWRVRPDDLERRAHPGRRILR